jgi:ATP cone domain
MLRLPDEIAHLPAWVRRRDGSQVPFDADRICQSLYAAAESLGTASPFLIRELTDVVLHFLAQEPFEAIASTSQIAEQIEKIVREIGQPSLARRYAELQRQVKTVHDPARKRITIACSDSPECFVKDCLEAYALDALFSRDVAAAIREGLLHVGGLVTPAALASLVLETPRLAELPWWLALDDWRTCGGERWIVESPEWLCTRQAHPALTPHLCERLLSLPILAQRCIELHLNIAEPPAWSLAHPAPPLFTPAEDEATLPERSNFLDGLLERWKTLDAPKIPALAWHLHERSFRDETERRQLHDLVRQALQGKAIRFVFDRPRAVPMLAEGLDRKCPGVLLEIGLDLAALARRLEIGADGAGFLKKLPSLARIAVSAAQQKYRFLRGVAEDSPLKRGFLLERASAVVVPIGLQAVAHSITGASLTRSPLSLDFALQILHTLKDTLHSAGRAVNLDIRLDSSSGAFADSLSAADQANPPRKQLEIAGKLHARAGAGTATLSIAEDAAQDLEGLVDTLAWAWSSTAVTRLQLQPAARTLEQGELPI